MPEITDTERIDFMEKQGRQHEAWMRSVLPTQGEYAWGSCIGGSVSISERGDMFRFKTLRESIDEAILRERVILGEIAKYAQRDFLGDTEPDEPVVQILRVIDIRDALVAAMKEVNNGD